MKKTIKGFLAGVVLAVSASMLFASSESVAKDAAKHFTPNASSFHEDLAKMNEGDDFAALGRMTVASNSEYKRILMYVGYDKLSSDYNAVAVASCEDMTVLKFDTEADTVKAYNEFVKQFGSDKVFYDHIVTLADDEMEAESFSADTTEDVIAVDNDCEAHAKMLQAPTFVGKMSSAQKSKKIIVAILDTGLNPDHEKVKGKYVSGYSYYNNGSTKDGHNHGTMCAGCVLGVTKGTNVKVMPIKVLSDSGSGWSSDIVAGIKWATAHGASVISMSLGGSHGEDCNCESEAITAAYNKNITVVVAAGNEAQDTKYVCPAKYTKAITVSAIDRDHAKAYFTNYGKSVDVCNYGVSIYMPDCRGKNTYSTASGTSFSCPFTSGSAALLYAAGVATTPAKVEKTLRNYAKDLGDKGWDQYYGAGVVRLGKIKVTSTIGFEKSTLTMRVGTTKSEYFNNPKKVSVKFSSSNTKVATVSSKGVITAKKAGTATIKAKTSDKTYSCKVTVVQPKISGSDSVKKGKTITLKFKNGKGTTSWYSSNKLVATVNSKGVVKGVAKGTATIIAINDKTAYTKKITVK